MPYWKLYYHIVWGTKNGFDFISPAWEKDLYDYLWGKAIALECIPHTINGMPNHLHVVLSVPPKLALAKTIGLLKGSSSHHINENYLDHTFAWRSIDQGDGFYISIFFISVPGGIWPEKNDQDHQDCRCANTHLS